MQFIDPWLNLQGCQASKNSSGWSISITVLAARPSSQLGLRRIAPGHGVISGMLGHRSFSCFDLKTDKCQTCWLPPLKAGTRVKASGGSELHLHLLSESLFPSFGPLLIQVPEITSDSSWENVPHVGPLWNTATFFLIVTSGFTIMDLPCGRLPAHPVCCHPDEFRNNTGSVSSRCCCLGLGWKISNNKRGKFNPCSVD